MLSFRVAVFLRIEDTEFVDDDKRGEFPVGASVLCVTKVTCFCLSRMRRSGTDVRRAASLTSLVFCSREALVVRSCRSRLSGSSRWSCAGDEAPTKVKLVTLDVSVVFPVISFVTGSWASCALNPGGVLVATAEVGGDNRKCPWTSFGTTMSFAGVGLAVPQAMRP